MRQNLATLSLNLLKKHNEEQDKELQKKVKFLLKESYHYYLESIINQIIQNKEIDFHPALYRAGIIINNKAKRLANEAVSNVIKQGHKRINECFSKRVKEIKMSEIKLNKALVD